MKKKVRFKESSGNKYFYMDFGNEGGKSNFRVWVSSFFVKEENHYSLGGKIEKKYFIEFPIIGGEIIKTEKGGLVIKPSENKIVHNIFVPCGFQGKGSFKIVSENVDMDAYKYRVNSSWKNNVGISEGALISLKMSDILKVKWHKTGRGLNSPKEGIDIYHPEEVIHEKTEEQIEKENDIKEALSGNENKPVSN